MNAPTFDGHSVTCPICNRHEGLNQGKILNGLFTCPYCQARLVVTWSGHYVRDPFNFKQVAIGKMLQRQSRPLARLLRDFGIVKHPSLIVMVVATVMFGLVWINVDRTWTKNNSIQKTIESVNKLVESEISR